jgi:omega-6 fatty acid desaturase (delta-12 desaturase)
MLLMPGAGFQAARQYAAPETGAYFVTSQLSDTTDPSAPGEADDRPSPDGGPLAETRPFARSHNGIAGWQVVSTMAMLAAVWVCGALGAPWPSWPLLGLFAAGLIMRLFVLQHDCGHLSLFDRRPLNDGVGRLLACFSGVAYHTWRSEHNWHHAHQGKLSHRGVDGMNSPMTRLEAIADPRRALATARTITPANIGVLGAVSILVLRKRPHEFFQFREGFRWPIPDRDRLVKSIRWTNLGHALLHLGVFLWLGAPAWAALYLLPLALAGVIGSWMFWVQHNFEQTYHAEEADWKFVDAGLQGASYLALPGPLAWFTASIGLHHVHHLNPRIPNYRLEAARRAVPALSALAPLSGEALRRSFTHVFWDEETRRMVPLPEECQKPL